MAQVEELELAEVNEISLPHMREEIMRSLMRLADPAHQKSVWVDGNRPVDGAFDNLTLRLNILYDDTLVLDSPQAALGMTLRSAAEVEAMEVLKSALDSLLDELGTDLSDAEYLAAPQWAEVVDAAAKALSVLSAE